jgi:hypothetical protein
LGKENNLIKIFKKRMLWECLMVIIFSFLIHLFLFNDTIKNSRG